MAWAESGHERRGTQAMEAMPSTPPSHIACSQTLQSRTSLIHHHRLADCGAGHPAEHEGLVQAVKRADVAAYRPVLGAQHVPAEHALPRLLHHGDVGGEAAVAQRKPCGGRRVSAGINPAPAGIHAAQLACSALPHQKHGW